MKYTDYLTKLANRFERKISLAQQVAGDIEDLFRKAGLYEKAAEVSPMLSAAGIPDDCSVEIAILVDRNLNVTFPVVLNSTTIDAKSKAAFSAKLSKLLSAKYAAAMKKILVDNKFQVTDTMQVNWLKF